VEVTVEFGPTFLNMREKIHTNCLNIKNNMSSACDVSERIVSFDMRNK